MVHATVSFTFCNSSMKTRDRQGRSRVVTRVSDKSHSNSSIRREKIAKQIEEERANQVKDLWEDAMNTANYFCIHGSDEDCAIAWDTVHEYQKAYDRIFKTYLQRDPLEEYCQDHLDEDECRVYED